MTTVSDFAGGTMDLNRESYAYWERGDQANIARWQDLNPRARTRLDEIQTEIERLTEEASGIILAAPPEPGIEPKEVPAVSSV